MRLEQNENEDILQSGQTDRLPHTRFFILSPDKIHTYIHTYFPTSRPILGQGGWVSIGTGQDKQRSRLLILIQLAFLMLRMTLTHPKTI